MDAAAPGAADAEAVAGAAAVGGAGPAATSVGAPSADVEAAHVLNVKLLVKIYTFIVFSYRYIHSYINQITAYG